MRHAWEVGGHTPIFVTENGIATANDARRIDYTYDALAGLHDAMSDGIDVLGYLHWSLLDNYEWGSFRPTFSAADLRTGCFLAGVPSLRFSVIALLSGGGATKLARRHRRTTSF